MTAPPRGRRELLLCQSRAQGCHREVLFSDRNVCPECQEGQPPGTSSYFSPNATAGLHRLPLKSQQEPRAAAKTSESPRMRRGKSGLPPGPEAAPRRPQRPQPGCSKAKAGVAPPRLWPQLPLHPNQHVKNPSSPSLYNMGWGAPTVMSAGPSALATGSDGFIVKVRLQHAHLIHIYLCAQVLVCTRVCVNVYVYIHTYTRKMDFQSRPTWLLDFSFSCIMSWLAPFPCLQLSLALVPS